jgi:nickel/cobalt transporter (NicO) family protein
MTEELTVLYITAATIGFIHTLIGPDHYLPFIMMAKARNWSNLKTFWITFICGIGHVGSSVILGLAGIALGIAVSKLEAVESIRGNIAAWLIIAFGLIYMVWGIKRAVKNKKHSHQHMHINENGQAHTHGEDGKKKNITPWVLFTIFVFGPCEPLIPIIMYPAAAHSWFGIASVSLVFGIITISTMLTLVFLALYGFKLIPLGKLERYSHALAGFVILMCGVSIQFLGL